jgi:hypothetical protein
VPLYRVHERTPVPAFHVPPAVRRPAEAALVWLRADLGLPDLALRWYRNTCTAHDAPAIPTGAPAEYGGGYYDPQQPGVAWLACDLGAHQVLDVLAHEARHAAQWERGAGWSDDAAEREADACWYATQAQPALRAHAGSILRGMRGSARP